MPSQPAAGKSLNLLPWPRAVDVGSGTHRLAGAVFSAEFSRQASQRIESAVRRLGESVARRTGLPARGAATSIRIDCEAPAGAYPGPDADESYWLVIDDAGIYVDAATEWGVLRALVTLLALVTPAGHVPHVAIDDAPRFRWRGLLLDPARRFLEAPVLERTLEGMALCKLNVLHLHLSDDQGFRFPSASFPELASESAYTTAELTRIVALAADLGIRVIPELDMPGHVTSWLVAHPEWGNRPATATRRFGVHPACLDPTNEAVYAALGRILDDLVAVFPDPCIHLGGDEVSPGWWMEDPRIREFMAEHGYAGVGELQAHFHRRVGELVRERGRRPIGWDEVLSGELGRDWIVQAWRGVTARDRALARGHGVIVSAPYYLDLNYPVDVHYAFDPAGELLEELAREDGLLEDPRFRHVAEGMRWTHQWRSGAETLAEATRGHGEVLGGEACLWGELVDGDTLDQRLWSRLPAVAERLWSEICPAADAPLDARLDAYLSGIHPLRGVDLDARLVEQLEALGIDARWRPIVDLLEPVKWYARLLGEAALAARLGGTEMPRARPYDADSRLDRLADCLPPESRAMSRLEAMVRDLDHDKQANDQLARIAERWKALAREQMPEMLAPFREPVAELADLVLARLAGRMAPQARLDGICLPRGELMVAPGPRLRGWLTRLP